MKKSKGVAEDFWNDCTNNQISSSFEPFSKMISYNKYAKNYGRNKKIDKDNSKIEANSKNLMNFYSFQNQTKDNKKNVSKNKSKNKTIENPDYSRIYKRHPLLHKITILHDKEEKEIIQKKKSALMRCLGLYAYGIEVQKEKLLNEKNTKYNRQKEEILKCTFKPKINKYPYSRKAKFLQNFINKNNNIKDENNLNAINKISTKISNENNDIRKSERTNNNKNKDEEEKSSKLEECTFRPQLYKQNIKYVFRSSKSIESARYNNLFIWRYNKAREKYMIKKIKQLSIKDECYKTMISEYDDFTNRYQLNNEINNTIDNNRNGYLLENKRKIKPIKNIVQILRNELLEINLNDEEEK